MLINKTTAAALAAMVLIFCSYGPAQARTDSVEEIKRATVKIFSVKASPSYYSPWNMKGTSSVIGSGSLIEDGLILTNAHIVSDAKYIQVQLFNDPKKYQAVVKNISHTADLAVLEVMDGDVLSGIKPFEFGELPKTLEEVEVYGYPTGGATLSITRGVLSRIEFQKYSLGGNRMLAGQIDAAINPGNSGGPVIANDRLIGIAMQKKSSSAVDNIGYFIPSVVIEHFLKDIEDGANDGYPHIGLCFQKMESPSLRKKYLMAEEQTGVLVNCIFDKSPASGRLLTGDVILKMDGHDVANDATVAFREDERLDMAYVITSHQVGEELDLEIIRDGSLKNVSFPLTLAKKDAGDLFVVKPYEFDIKPRFFIYGGFVFSPLSKNYICTWRGCDAPAFIMNFLEQKTSADKKEVVILLRALPGEVNTGYHGVQNVIVEKVNGRDYTDFQDFYEIVTGSEDEFVTFQVKDNFQVVVEREMALETHKEILATYGIEKDMHLAEPE